MKTYFGIAYLPKLMALTPVVSLATLHRGKSIGYLGARRTLSLSTFFSGFGLIACYVLLACGYQEATLALFILKEVYVVLLIEQYWSFVNDLLLPEEGKAFNGKILAISSIGSISGGVFVHQTSEILGSSNMILVGRFYPWEPVTQIAGCGKSALKVTPLAKKVPTAPSDPFGLKLFEQEKALNFILLTIIASQFIAAFAEINFQQILQLEIPDLDQQTSFSGLFLRLSTKYHCFYRYSWYHLH